jgi:hypothetical protein
VTDGGPAPYNDGMTVAPVALLAVVAVVAAGCGSSGEGRPVPSGSSPRLLEAPQVQVVAFPNGEVRICTGASDLMFGPPACPFGPRVVGVRVDALPNHSSSPRERWGNLSLLGVYHDSTFRVRSQGRWRVAPDRGSPFDGPVPCPAPRGGWRAAESPASQRATIAAYQRTHRGDLVSVSFFHDVLVVASSHPPRTRALLGPAWPRQLCVVRAHYSRPFVNRVRQKLLGLMRPMSQAARYGWVTGAGGYGVDAGGQTTISLQVLLETPELRAFLRRLPRGLVSVESTFRPAREGQA